MGIIYKIRLIIFWFIILSIGQVLCQVQPKFNLTTAVTGADAYQIIVTADADESDPIWISDPLTNFPVTYPGSAPSLEHGMVYYARVIALKDGTISNWIQFGGTYRIKIS